jgi:hypothetical protein
LSDLKSAHTIQGTVLRRDDADYEHARLDAVWNARKPDRYPDVIVIAAHENDVVEAVQLARAEGLNVSVRSGGHSWVGNGVREGGLLIDLSNLQDIELDVEQRIAAVRPAVKGPALNALLLEQDLFFPTGHAPTVGIGGFILGGGYGWNSRYWGPACLSIKAIDVVLADGRLVHADDENHPDLLWAARGSGPGFFGVVTRFYLDVYPNSTKILRTVHTYPLELRDEVLSWSYDNLESLSPAVEISAKVGFTPGLEVQTASLTATAFCTAETGEDILAPLETIPFRDKAIRATVNQETSIAELYEIADRLNPDGLRWSLDGIWADAPSTEIIEAARPMLSTIPDGINFVLWMLWGNYPQRQRMLVRTGQGLPVAECRLDRPRRGSGSRAVGTRDTEQDPASVTGSAVLRQQPGRPIRLRAQPGKRRPARENPSHVRPQRILPLIHDPTRVHDGIRPRAAPLIGDNRPGGHTDRGRGKPHRADVLRTIHDPIADVIINVSAPPP